MRASPIATCTPLRRARQSLLRALALTCLCAALAACGGSSGGGGGGGPTTLLLESFGGPFPGIWEIVQHGDELQIDPSAGDPAPCLRMIAGNLHQPWVRHRPVPADAWSSAGGIDLFVFARFLPAPSGAAGIEILELDGFAPGVDGAVANLDVSGSTTLGVELHYVIITHSGIREATEFLPADAGWHDYAFQIRPDGTASWFRDGTERLSTGAAVVGTANLGLSLRGFFQQDSWFDEVLVRRP